MKNLEIKNLSSNDLIRKIKIYENNYQNIKFSHFIKNHKNPMLIKELRKKIAQLKTELNKKNK
ncbi:50S ribosomal protein L29 [Blattabacterium cuenoti]|uniref:50S ribosomal protein L29 n=1 Tax=Blattabacterium cuenoti TaxID=1653831 RepID=UPI00163BAAD5|nr:50S ribosomal protein L29 [Blattabacterium cuenoti]